MRDRRGTARRYRCRRFPPGAVVPCSRFQRASGWRCATCEFLSFEFLLCATSVFSVSLWLGVGAKILTTETQRTQRLHREMLLFPNVAGSVILRERQRGANGFRVRGSAHALIEIRKPLQCERVVRIDRTCRFVVTDRVVFTTKPLQHL